MPSHELPPLHSADDVCWPDGLEPVLQEAGAAAELAEVQRRLSQLARESVELRARLLRLERSLRLGRPAAGAPVQPEPAQPAAGRREASAQLAAFDQFLFAQRYGLSPAAADNQPLYLELFIGRERVVDLYCERGDRLALLRQHTGQLVGVDPDQELVELCRDRGLPALQAEPLAYLRSRADGALDGVLVGRLGEYLSPAALLELVELCAHKCAVGAVVLFENSNPLCARALGDFYLDHRRQRPVHPYWLKFVAEQAGFLFQSLDFNAVDGSEPASSVFDASDPAALNEALPAEVGRYRRYCLAMVKREGPLFAGPVALGGPEQPG
jgi:hypothetical protein